MSKLFVILFLVCILGASALKHRTQHKFLLRQQPNHQKLIAQIKTELNKADTNSDGSLSWDEVQIGIKAGCKINSQFCLSKDQMIELKNLFNVHADSTGKVNIDQVAPAVVHLVELLLSQSSQTSSNGGSSSPSSPHEKLIAQIKTELNKADTNSDGSLSWDEVQIGIKAGCKINSQFCLSKDQMVELKNLFNVHADSTGKVNIEQVAPAVVHLVELYLSQPSKTLLQKGGNNGTPASNQTLQDRIDELKVELSKGDVNGDGLLSRDEVINAFEADCLAHPNNCLNKEQKDEVKNFFDAHADKNGLLDIDQAAHALVNRVY